jgi:ElaB/YqjD/DUF883 family membrane-anchored ribosome-binding protein
LGSDILKETKMETTNTLNATDQTASRAHETIDTAAIATAQSLRNASGTIDRAAATAHNAVNSVAEAVKPAAEWLLQQRQAAVDVQQKLMDDACKYVTANPWKAMAIAATAGFLLGHLMQGRNGAR